MVKANSRVKPFTERPGESAENREKRIAETAAQLKGKRVAVTAGTELEQIMLVAIRKAGLQSSDLTIIHSSPEDSLAAFLAA